MKLQNKATTASKFRKALYSLKVTAIVLVLSLISNFSVQAQVVFENSAFTTIANGTTATSISMNYDPGSAANSIMIVAVTTSRDDVTAATFDGEPLEPLGNVVDGNSRVVFFYLSNPSPGLATLQATLESDSRGFAMGVATFSNVNQANPLNTFTSATGSSLTPTVNNVPTSPGSMVFSAISYRNGSRTYNGVGADQTELWQFQSAASNDRHWSVGSRKTITAGTTTSMSYSFSNAEDFSAGAISINAIPECDLSVNKTVNFPGPYAGQTIQFTLTATNNGPDIATLVQVEDLIPSGFTYVSHTASGSTEYNAAAGIWDIGTLNNAGSATLTINTVVNTTGNFTNTASISGNVEDNTSGNNTSSVTIVLCQAGGTPPLFNNN